MLAIKIPKEIKDYKEKIVLGLNLRQLICGGIALAVCVPLYIWGKNFIHEELIAWIVILVALPCAAIGWFKYNGMTFEIFLKAVFLHLFVVPSKRKFKSNSFYRHWQNEAEKQEKAKKNSYNEQAKVEMESLYNAYLMENEKNGARAHDTEKKAYIKSVRDCFSRIYAVDEDVQEGEVTALPPLAEQDRTYPPRYLPELGNEETQQLPELHETDVEPGGGSGKPPRKQKPPKKPWKGLKRRKKEIDKKKKAAQKRSYFEEQGELIKKKLDDDARYVLTPKELLIMKQYYRKLESNYKKEVQAAKNQASAKNKSMKKRRKAKTFLPRTSQQTIPYDADYDEGMFEVAPKKFSKLIEIMDINYVNAKEDDQITIFLKYGAFLNYFGEDMKVAVIIDNRVVSSNEQDRTILYPLTGDGYDKHRIEYNKILKRQMLAGRNDIRKSLYAAVTIDCDTPYEALLKFAKIETEILKNLRGIGSYGRVLSTTERLSILHDKFRKGREGDFKVDYNFLKTQGLSSKDYIAPSSFQFEKKHFKIEDGFYRMLYVNNLPASLTDDFIQQICDNDFPLTTTINIEPVAQDKAIRLVKKRLTGMEANRIDAEKKAMRAGYNPETISHDLKNSILQGETLLDSLLNKNQRMFFVSITLMVYGETLQELERNCANISSQARTVSAQVQCFDFQQEAAFKVTLPIGVPPKGISVERTLTTESTCVFMPFTSQELFQAGGFYYGLNQVSKNLIMCNRTHMKSPSGFILGSSGSGKSFATKREILNILLNDDKTNVLVIDPENEYSDFARVFGGEVITLSTSSKIRINPMDMDIAYAGEDGADPVRAKSEYIMSIVQCMLSEGDADSKVTTITPSQKTIVDKSVKKCYEKYVASGFNNEFIPTLQDLQNQLDIHKHTSKEAQDLAEGAEYYTKGSMNIFADKTNVDYSNRFVVFNVRDLGDQLKQIALLITLDFIWNRMLSNQQEQIRTYCYCDEIHILFANDFSAKYLRQLYKRGRKYGLIMTGITQNIEDLLGSSVARGMVGNSDFLLLLNQAPEDLKLITPMLSLSEQQCGYVSRAQEGSGLLFAENVIVPFLDKFPENSYLYTLMSTKFGEEDAEISIDDFLATVETMSIDDAPLPEVEEALPKTEKRAG